MMDCRMSINQVDNSHHVFCLHRLTFAAICCIIVHLCFRWITDGGEVGQKCSILHYKMSAIFYKADKTRRLCTPPLDLRQAGSLRFRFLFGEKILDCFQLNIEFNSRFYYFIYLSAFIF